MSRKTHQIIACLAAVVVIFSATICYAANSKPQVGIITPSSGTSSPNQTVSFTTTYTDANGWQNIQLVYLLVNTSTAGANCFYGYYNQNTNKLYLRDDRNKAWLGGYAPGSSYTIENSYAKLNCASTTVSGTGTTITVTWSVTFKSTFIGAKNTYLYVKDDSNAYCNWTKKGTWTIQTQTDTTPPTGTIKINNDTQYTKTTSVTLNLSAADTGSGVSQMQFSNDNTTYSTAEAYATTKTWTLTTSDGTKTVYAKYKDVAGNWSTAYSDTIILDTIPPAVVITSPQNGAIVVTSTVTLSGTVDGAPFSEVKNLVHGSNVLTKTATDAAGNTGSASVTVIYNLAPAISSLAPANNSSFTAGDIVTIQVTAADPDGDSLQYQYYVDSNIKQAWTTTSTYNWQTQVGDNNGHIIKVEVKDPYGATASKQNSVYIFRKPIAPPAR